MKTNAPPSPSNWVCPHCRGELWLCVDHRQPWPHEGCDAEGTACVCNPERAVRWREVFAERPPEEKPE